MTTATVTEFKANVSAYLREVERGNKIIITHHGHQKARVVPITPTSEKSSQISARQAAREIREKLGKKPQHDTWSIRDYITYGQK